MTSEHLSTAAAGVSCRVARVPHSVVREGVVPLACVPHSVVWRGCRTSGLSSGQYTPFLHDDRQTGDAGKQLW